MEKAEIRLGKAITITGVGLTPVMRVRVFSDGRKWLSVYASVEPVAVIAVTPAGRLLFKVTGEQVTFDQFEAEFGIRL